MPKVRIDCDERYPDFLITSDVGEEVQISAKKLAWIRRVTAEYAEVQDYLDMRREKARKKRLNP